MEPCISFENEDEAHRERWLKKSKHSLSVIYAFICSISVLFYIGMGRITIIHLLVILFVYVCAYCVLHCLMKHKLYIQLQIVSLTSGSYGYDVKYKDKDKEVAVGISSVKIAGFDKIFSEFI